MWTMYSGIHSTWQSKETHVNSYGIDIIKCGQCTKKFSVNGTFRTHKLTHTGEKSNIVVKCILKYSVWPEKK